MLFRNFLCDSLSVRFVQEVVIEFARPMRWNFLERPATLAQSTLSLDSSYFRIERSYFNGQLYPL